MNRAVHPLMSGIVHTIHEQLLIEEKKPSYQRRAKFGRNVPEFMFNKEQGRNELCNCKSGKKYKNCCGIRS